MPCWRNIFIEQNAIKKYPPHTNIGCLNIYGTYVTTNIFTNNNVGFFFSDLKIVYYNNY